MPCKIPQQEDSSTAPAHAAKMKAVTETFYVMTNAVLKGLHPFFSFVCASFLQSSIPLVMLMQP